MDCEQYACSDRDDEHERERAAAERPAAENEDGGERVDSERSHDRPGDRCRAREGIGTVEGEGEQRGDSEESAAERSEHDPSPHHSTRTGTRCSPVAPSGTEPSSTGDCNVPVPSVARTTSSCSPAAARHAKLQSAQVSREG